MIKDAPKSEIDHSKLDAVPAGADRFIRMFMRFEYALKDGDFCMAGNGNSAKADWDKFANTLGKAFLDEIAAKVPTLVNTPPKKQVFDGASLSWQDTDRVADVQNLFGAVRRVRNNLLHGAKSGDPDQDRNEKLIADAMIVLECALAACADIRIPYEGRF